jgi:hypothetical protein
MINVYAPARAVERNQIPSGQYQAVMIDEGHASFKSVGIQAQGRTTILKINYRNTRQILHTASLVAADLFTADDQDDDGIPLLKSVSLRARRASPRHHQTAHAA